VTAIIVTPPDVSSLTGVTVTETQVTLAMGMIAAATGLDLAELPDRATARDAANLRLAVIWQAAYGAGEAGTRDRSVASASANGASVTYTADSGTEGSSWGLSEIAALYLARLSWRRAAGGIRTVHVVPEALVRAADAQTMIEDEGYPPWVPLGGTP
jgi:hypothetical protein